MPTIRVRDWTKARLDELREQQNHSSHDSVVKTLLKDHELAAAREQITLHEPKQKSRSYAGPDDESEFAVPGMKVLAELESPKSNIGFLWCPNCNSEVAHFSFPEPATFEQFETSCPQCFTDLDQHALVDIEIDYPLEEKLVEDELAYDLKTAVVDYWDRRLRKTATKSEQLDVDGSIERMVWKFDQYAKDFMWEWPSEVPVVGLEAGKTYERTDTEESIEVLERVPQSGTGIDQFRVKRHRGDSTASVESKLLDSEMVYHLLLNRKLKLQKE